MTSPFSPRVTACVVTHDEELSIERCLRALLAQDFSEPFHVLVIDNASNDRTVAIAERFGVEVIRRKVNNLGAARQNAVESARTPLIAFTDADCVVPTNWLSSLVSAFDRNRDRGFVAIGTPNLPPSNGLGFHEAQKLMFTSLAGHFGSEQAKPPTGRVREVSHLSTCSVLYDRDVLVDAGGFDRAHRWVCEDVDLSYRLRARDWKLLKIESIAVEHHAKPSHRSWAKKIFRYGWGQIQVMRKTREHRKLKFVLPLVFALSFPFLAIWDRDVFLVYTSVYVALLILLSMFQSALRGRPDLAARMVALYAITHVTYGLGLLAGLAGWSGGRGSRG